MTEHTPGPWGVSPRYRATIRAGSANVATVNIRNGLHPNNPEESEAYANARLIAAAPELLEAAAAVVAMWESPWPTSGMESVEHGAPMLKLRRAIAKAEGKDNGN